MFILSLFENGKIYIFNIYSFFIMGEKGYYIDGVAFGLGKISKDSSGVVAPLNKPGIQIHIAYGEVSDGFKSHPPIKAYEGAFSFTKHFDSPDDIYVAKAQVLSPKSVKWFAEHPYKTTQDQNAHRIFDFYLVQFYSTMCDNVRQSSFLFGIARAIGSDKPEDVKKHLKDDDTVETKPSFIKIEGIHELLQTLFE
jgi:hypothetical protein